MPFNFDIWSEIVSFLEYPEDVSTLRALAVTSRPPSCLALGAIWRNGEQLMTIVSVVNSFATSTDEPFLEYRTDPVGYDGSELNGTPGSVVGGWVLNRPLPHASRQRALTYLARIKKLTMSPSRPPNKKMLLLRMLSRCLDRLEPLLPHLRHLEVEETSFNCTDWLTPLLSPTLKVLNITTVHIAEHEVTLPVINLLTAQGCDLQVFTYNGGPVQRSPEKLTLFKNLQHVQLARDDHLQKESSITVIEFLSSLPSLRSLACNLIVFHHCTTEDMFTHDNLQRLHLVSPAVELHELFRCCAFPSVTEAIITREGFDIFGFENFGLRCPNVQTLRLHANHPIINKFGVPTTYFGHFSPLLSLPMRVFNLTVSKFHFTSAEFRAISESWPNLCSFSIWSMKGFDIDFLPALSAFSGHRHLQRLDFGLRLSHLLNDIPRVRDLMAVPVPTEIPRSSLPPCTLYLSPSYYGSIQTATVTRTEKCLAMEYLLSLFPCLEGLEFKYQLFRETDLPDIGILKELQEILLEAKREKE